MTYVKNIFVSFCMILLLLPGMLYSQGTNLKVKARVTPNVATVGDKLEYRINIAGKGLAADGTAGFEVLLPKSEIYYQQGADAKSVKKSKKQKDDKEKDEDQLTREKSVPLYIINNKTKDDRSDGDVTDLTVIIDISYFKPGKYTLPEIEILGKDKIKIGYQVPTVEIKESNATGQMESIEPPLDLKGNYVRLILLIIGIVVLVLVMVFLVRLLIWALKAKSKKEVLIPPIESFMKDIKKFNGKKLIDKNRIDDYVFGISIIFRRFLSGLLHIDAEEMTSEEINDALQSVLPQHILNTYKNDLDKMFQLWDLSRYAEFLPSGEILHNNLEQTIKIAEQLNTDISKERGNDTTGV